jgi:hypothetical protein
MLVATTACSGAPPQALVTVESNLPPTSGIASVRFSTSVPMESRVLPVRPEDFPLTFAVVPRGGDVSRIAEVRVEALDAGGVLIMRRDARVPFMAGAVTFVSLCLESACLGVSCASGQTCRRPAGGGGGTCVAIESAPVEACGAPDAAR